MIIGKGLYPCPVLSDFNDDYIESSFTIEYNVSKVGFKTNLINIEIKLKDETIERMIEEEKAVLAIHLECSRTSHRKLFELNKEGKNLQIPVDSKQIVDRVELSGIIIAKENIDIYTNPNINKKYYGENYVVRNLGQGDLIGATVTQILDIPMKSNDFESISSIIKVGFSNDDLMSVDYDDDVIIIKLPKTEYKRYCKLSKTVYSTIIMTSTVLPSLVYVLDMISDGEG